ncbi:hypothetical protein EK69_004427 [Salmonella enterica subsp. enterica]|nr:hypothetical protein [Salmonella enterica subsp. enterica serovar Baguida]
MSKPVFRVDEDRRVIHPRDRSSCVVGKNPRYAVYDISELRLELVGFYVPVSYYFHAQEIIQKGGDLTPVFDNIGALRESLSANKSSEKDGKNR